MFTGCSLKWKHLYYVLNLVLDLDTNCWTTLRIEYFHESSPSSCGEMIFPLNGLFSRSVLPEDCIWSRRPTSRWSTRETRCHHVCERTWAQCYQVHQMFQSLHFLSPIWTRICPLAFDQRAVLMSLALHVFFIHRGWQRDFRRDMKDGENVPCWFIHNNGTGLIDGEASDYIVSDLYKTV